MMLNGSIIARNCLGSRKRIHWNGLVSFVDGLFLSADAVQDNFHGLDPYTYVENNFETRNDPTGH